MQLNKKPKLKQWEILFRWTKKPPNNDFSKRNGNNSSKDPKPLITQPKASTVAASNSITATSKAQLIYTRLRLDALQSCRQRHWCGLLCLYQDWPILTQCCLHILVFLFSTTLLPTFFDWRRDLRTPQSRQKHSEQQYSSLVGEESLSHQLAPAFPSPVPPAGGCVGPFITASILSPFCSSRQKQAFPRRGWGRK